MKAGKNQRFDVTYNQDAPGALAPKELASRVYVETYHPNCGGRAAAAPTPAPLVLIGVFGMSMGLILFGYAIASNNQQQQLAQTKAELTQIKANLATVKQLLCH